MFEIINHIVIEIRELFAANKMCDKEFWVTQ
jgi:hypothetical protein